MFLKVCSAVINGFPLRIAYQFAWKICFYKKSKTLKIKCFIWSESTVVYFVHKMASEHALWFKIMKQRRMLLFYSQTF